VNEQRFRRIYPDRWGLFVDGVCVCDYRRAGQVWRVRQFCWRSSEPLRQVFVASEDVARRVASELAVAAPANGAD
jgi:hypothetical protein